MFHSSWYLMQSDVVICGTHFLKLLLPSSTQNFPEKYERIVLFVFLANFLIQFSVHWMIHIQCFLFNDLIFICSIFQKNVLDTILAHHGSPKFLSANFIFCLIKNRINIKFLNTANFFWFSGSTSFNTNALFFLASDLHFLKLFENRSCYCCRLNPTDLYKTQILLTLKP
jgi:hypothetical protein